jgi:type VI protein secretion system component VasF
VNPWPFILAAYLLAAVGMLMYLVSVRRRMRALAAQLAALRRHVEARGR